MKKLSAFFVMLMLIFAAGICVHAEDLTITTASLKKGTAYEEYYDKIEASGGSGDYTFEYVGGTYPKGLVFGDDGVISGIPTRSGVFLNMIFQVTDNVTGEIAQKRFSLNIQPVLVEIAISDTEYTYEEGKSYKATVVCTTNPDIIPTVTYGNGQKEITSAGSYVIKVKLPTGYKCNYQNNSLLNVHKNSTSALRVTGVTVPYDGEPHEVAVSATPENLSYEVLYQKKGETEYTTDIPVERGTYSAVARTTDSNYEFREAYAAVNITDELIDFEVTNNTQRYTGNPLEPTVTPSKKIIYNVTYKNIHTGDETSEVTGVGTYQIIITTEDGYDVGYISNDIFTITNSIADITVTAENETITYGEYFNLNAAADIDCDMSHLILSLVNNTTKKEYSLSEMLPAGEYTVKAVFDYDDGAVGVGTITAPILVVDKRKISFNVSAAELDYTGEAQTVEVTTEDTLVSKTDYSVSYKRHEDIFAAMTRPGNYDVVVTFSNDNFAVAPEFSATVTVNKYFYLEVGNSPAAMIKKDNSKSDEWKNSALEYFSENLSFDDEHLPNGCSTNINYPSINGINYDIDENTVIVNNWSDFEDPGMVVVDEDETRVIEGTTETTPEESAPAVYTLYYNDSAANMTRYVIVLGNKFGDVNGDGFVNAVDANLIRKRVQSGEINAGNIFDARICDINKDGILNMDDADMIYNRFSTLLYPYYPWI